LNKAVSVNSSRNFRVPVEGLDVEPGTSWRMLPGPTSVAKLSAIGANIRSCSPVRDFCRYCNDVGVRRIVVPEFAGRGKDARVATQRAYALTLGGLALAFGLRVLGQALVAVDQASFLPPMDEWYSGLIPYSALLPIQIGILAVQATVSRDIWSGHGPFATSRPAVSRGLEWLSYAYFALMVLRYIVTMVFYPERRWLAGTIPILFHCVLAAYLFTLGRYYSLPRDPSTRE
jgi:hypothetical protein